MTGTYDAAERTLTNGDGVVLTNVVASGTDLTIGRQTDNDGIDGVTTLDLSGTITGADGSTYAVAHLDDFAFYYCEGITSVTLPAGLTSISAVAGPLPTMALISFVGAAALHRDHR